MQIEDINNRRYMRKKCLLHFRLAFLELFFSPAINIVWIPYIVIVFYCEKIIKTIMNSFSGLPYIEFIYKSCIKSLSVIIPIILFLIILEFIGFFVSVKDEADIRIVFDDIKAGRQYPPILLYKKRNRKYNTIEREFYSTIPFQQWKEKKEAICDFLNIHMIGDITYGGKKRDKGNRIYFESAKGRKPKERGILYDDSF